MLEDIEHLFTQVDLYFEERKAIKLARNAEPRQGSHKYYSAIKPKINTNLQSAKKLSRKVPL